MKNKIEELINKVYEAKNIDALRAVLTSFAKEVAVIDEEVFMNTLNENNLVSATDAIHLYNRLILEQFEEKQQPIVSEPPSAVSEQPLTLQVGWEYQNGRGEWVEIVNNDFDTVYPFNGSNGNTFTSIGKRFLDGDSNDDLILSTGRPVKKEKPSPNWWESLQGGELVKTDNNSICAVKNWYQEQLCEKRVWIQVVDGFFLTTNYCTLYTPTPDEALSDFKAGKINEEQFKRVYKA